MMLTMRRYAFLGICLTLAASSYAVAQPAASPRAEAKPEVPADAAYTVDQIRTRVRFENDGTGRREMQTAIKVFDEQAVRTFGQISLFYQSETEDLAVTQIGVRKPDGTVVPTTAAGVQDLAVRPSAQVPTFLDLRQKAITVSALRPGDTVSLTAVWTTRKPIAPGQFWFEHSFDVHETVRDEELEIDLPAARDVSLKVRKGAPAEEHGGAGAVTGDRRVYRWKTSHPEPTAKEEKLQVGEDAPPVDVRLSSFRNWDEFAGWYVPLVSAGPDEAVKARAAALTAGAKDEAAKIAAIYHFVSAEIRYVSLSFGLGRFAPHAPADVMAHQYGDCKDKAILLKALLEAAGIRSVPVLLNTGRSIDEDFASPLEFDHMIAVIPRGGQAAGGTWMDTTLEVAPLGLLTLGERDKRTLVLDRPGHAEVVRIPTDPPFPFLDEISIDGKVNSIGVLTAKVTLAIRGDSEILTRAVVRAIPHESLKDFASKLAEEDGVSGEVSDVSTSDPTSTADPFRITYQIRKPGYLDWAAATSEIETLPRVTILGGDAEDRKGLTRLVAGPPAKTRMHATIELPDGYDLEAPTPVTISKVGMTFTSSYRVDPHSLSIDRTFDRTLPDVPENAFGEYGVLVGIAEKDFAQHFKVRGHVATEPAVPNDATANELYKAAYSAYEAKRYRTAATLWKRNTEVDPKMGDAWDALGLAYKQLKEYHAAEAAIRTQLALDANDKRAYRDLADVLKEAGKNEEAVKAYARHVEINPLDGAALKTLGELYNDLDRSAEAAPVLEKASGLTKTPDAWIFAELGHSYLRLKDADKARRALDRALEISPSVAMRAKVAWVLAEAGLDLDHAAALANQSEKEIGDATQHLDVKSLDHQRLDDVESLGWDWDALGLVALGKGQGASAERYIRAAWRLIGKPEIAFHLGQALEKTGRSGEAQPYYQMAQALSDNPTDDMRAAVKRLTHTGDAAVMLKSAKRMAPLERLVALKAKQPLGKAEFRVVVGSDRKATDVQFSSGDEAMRALEAALRDTTYPLDFPGDSRVRIPLGVRVACIADVGCMAGVLYPYEVTLHK
jgi:tetratricopeptide (TPR) repeat protein